MPKRRPNKIEQAVPYLESLGGPKKQYRNTLTGEILSYNKALNLASQSRGHATRHQERKARAAATPTKSRKSTTGGRKPSPLGNAKERQAIDLTDPKSWTRRQREIVKNYVRQHPYDGTSEGFAGKPRNFSYNDHRGGDENLQKTKFNLNQKLDLLNLKLNAGVITKGEYNRQRKALVYIRDNVDNLYQIPARTLEYSLAENRIRDEYNKLRYDANGNELPREKRIVMTKKEFQEYRDDRDKLDRYSEIFYHF